MFGEAFETSCSKLAHRPHPVVRGHPFRALCSCPVPHTTASGVWKGQHSPLLCCHHANITLLINYQLWQRIDLFFGKKCKNGTPSRKQTCGNFNFTHVFPSVTIHMGCSVYCDYERHLQIPKVWGKNEVKRNWRKSNSGFICCVKTRYHFKTPEVKTNNIEYI